MSNFANKINAAVHGATGFDVPELDGAGCISRAEVLDALRRAKSWHDAFAQECQNQIDAIILANFSEAERDAGGVE